MAIVSPFRAYRNQRTHDKYSWLPPSKRSSAVVIGTKKLGGEAGRETTIVPAICAEQPLA